MKYLIGTLEEVGDAFGNRNDLDKTAAYFTLHTVLVKYIKIMSQLFHL